MKALVLPKILGSVVVCGFWISTPVQADLAENDYDDFSSERPMVVSPARLKQSLADAPAAVTIITQEQLQRFGIKNVMEALRLVPGFGIDYRGDEAQVYSHAANTIPRRLNVMIDGVTYFRPAFTSVDWEALPIAIEDVDRIEVTRAPSAATYGSNSFSAVVNVISLHPTKAGSEIDAAYSTHDDARIYGRTTLHGNNTSVRISAEVANARGFDRINDTKSRADTSFSKLNVRSVSQLGERDQIEMLGTLTKGERQILSIEKRQTSYPDIDVSDIALSAQWVRDLDDHQLKTHINYFHAVRTQEWSTCQPAATFLPEAANLWLINHDYVLALLGGSTPRGGGAEADAALRALLLRMAQYGSSATSNICVDTDQNYSETTIDLELQDTWQAADNLRLVGSLGYRNDGANSHSLINGAHRRDSQSASLDTEWRTEWTTLNIGNYFEHDNYSGGNNAPRAVLNVHLAPGHSLRFGWTRSFKTPEIRATNADWRYYGQNARPLFLGSPEVVYYLRALAPDNLHTEKLTEHEIGYVGQLHNIGTIINARFFDDRYYDLISEEYSIYNFDLTNKGRSHQRGVEFDTTTVLGTRWLLSEGIAYVDTDANTAFEYDNYAQLTGFIAGSYQLSRQWDVGLSYTATKYGNALTSFRRVDFTVNYQPDWLHHQLQMQWITNYFPTNSMDFSTHLKVSSTFSGLSSVDQTYNSKWISNIKLTWKFH